MSTAGTALVVGAATLAVVGAAAGGYAFGHQQGTDLDWHTVTVDRADVVSAEDGHRLLTVQVDGWSYGLENQVDRWLDERSTLHSNSWPECLEPDNPGAEPARNPDEVTFRFATSEVSGKALSWRPVLMVDCRG